MVSSACCDQVVPERSNTYAAPVREFLSGAPTTAVEPEIATEEPNSSPAAASEAVSFACCDQVVPERANTYAAPVREFLPGAPTTAVEPEDRHRGAELVVRGGVGGGQLRLL